MRQQLLALPLLLSAVRAAPGKTVDVTKAGVVGDGATVNTAAIQKAIDTCSADSGGTIQFPAGRYVTGAIQLKDNITLHLDEDAVLPGSTNAGDYRNVDPFIDGVGAEMGYAPIVATRAAARAAIFEWIEFFCSRTRLHSALGCKSPVDFDTKLN
jgi:polygalacturonase